MSNSKIKHLTEVGHQGGRFSLASWLLPSPLYCVSLPFATTTQQIKSKVRFICKNEVVVGSMIKLNE